MWVALALVARLAWLTDKSLWADEAARIAWAKGHDPMASSYFDETPAEIVMRRPLASFRDAMRMVARNYPPGYALFYYPWMSLFGDSDFALRLLAVLFGGAAVGVLWALARLLFSPHVAAWAGALAALSPFQVEYSREIGQYAPGLFFEAASLLFLCRYALAPRALDGALWATAAVAAIACHTYSGLLIAAEGLALAVLLGLRLARPASRVPSIGLWRSAWTLAWPGALMIGGVASFVRDLSRGGVGEAANIGRPFSFETLVGAYQYGLPTWWLGDAIDPGLSWHLLPAKPAAVGVFAVALLGAMRKANLARSFMVTLFLAPLALLAAAYLAVKNGQVLWPRYFVLLEVFFPVLTAAWLAGLSRSWRLVAGTVTVAGLAYGLFTYFHEPIKRPWRELTAVIERDASPNEAVVVYVPNMVEEMGWYLKRPLKLFGLHDKGHLRQELDTATAGRPGIWSVTAWGEGSPAVPYIRGHLGCRFTKTEDFAWFRLHLTHFTEPTGASTCGSQAAFELEHEECVVPAEASRLPVRGALLPGDSIAPTRLFAALEREPPVPVTVSADGTRFEAELPVPAFVPGSWVDLELRLDEAPLTTISCLVRVKPTPDPSVARVSEGRFNQPVTGQAFGRSDRLRFVGFAFSSGGLDHLELIVDDAVVGKRFAVGEDRKDVAAAYPAVPTKVAQFSGFDVSANVEWTPGPHVVALYGVDLDGARWLVEGKVNVTARQ